LPVNGNWTINQVGGSLSESGSGATTTLANVSAGTYSFTVINSLGCISPQTDAVTIDDNTSNDLIRPIAEFTAQVVDTTFFPSFPITITFSEAISGFSIEDLTLTNATAEDLQQIDDKTFVVTIIPAGPGPVKVEMAEGIATDLAGNPNDPAIPFEIIYDPLPALKIRPIITPGSQDEENNVLVIENIGKYPENTVKLVTKWGDLIKEWQNFENYTTTSSEQDGINYMDLKQGSYICILDYKDPVTGNNETLVQMIIILK
jgi:hypothetical protein